MNEISQALLSAASVIKQNSPELIAVDLLKQAGISEEDARAAITQELMEKCACDLLMDRGVDHDEAVKLVKAAGVNIKELPGINFDMEDETTAALLEKAAALIESQEQELEQLRSQPKVEVSEPLSKIASSGGFTQEELEALLQLPSETLVKVANTVAEPWSLGKAAGVATGSVDPFYDFLVS